LQHAGFDSLKVAADLKLPLGVIGKYWEYPE